MVGAAAERIMRWEGACAMEGEAEKQKHNGKRHDRSFKEAAAKLVTEQGYTPKQAASSLGVKVNTLQYWVKVYGTAPREQAETIQTLRLRVTELERENRRLTVEKEILKKATAFFAKEPS
jgi:transposase-like protein